MRQSVINYVKENGIKLAANSKALKLINNGASEAEVAVALQTTKAYKRILLFVRCAKKLLLRLARNKLTVLKNQRIIQILLVEEKMNDTSFIQYRF